MRSDISSEARAFVNSQSVAVLSTLTAAGRVEGVTVYYCFDGSHFYILTKSDSSKAHNMLANHQVALTIFDAEQIKTVQMQGKAHVEADIAVKQYVFDNLARPRRYEGEELLPPVTRLEAGGFIAFRITPTNFHYTDYKDKSKLIPHNYKGTLV